MARTVQVSYAAAVVRLTGWTAFAALRREGTSPVARDQVRLDRALRHDLIPAGADFDVVAVGVDASAVVAAEIDLSRTF